MRSGTMVITAAMLLCAAPAASAASVATVAKRLARDTEQLAQARTDLAETRVELRGVQSAHAKLRAQIEVRIVAIYKYGGAFESLSTVAAGNSVGQVSQSIDALDIVARHEAKELDRWNRLGKRATRLSRRRTSLSRTVRVKERAVEAARTQLDAARRTAQAARASAERMATMQDSPLLPKVGHPETNSMIASDGTGPDAGATNIDRQPIGYVESGVASMYSTSFTGEETANGERYDPNAFTAAHPTLPFGTWVTVSGPGGSVAVRINDRGPFVGGRVIDLSTAAAEAIGLPGIGAVTLRVQA
jgi:rare lipoprotein A